MRWAGVGGGEQLQLGHDRNSHDANTMAHAILVGKRRVGATLIPHHLIGALH